MATRADKFLARIELMRREQAVAEKRLSEIRSMSDEDLVNILESDDEDEAPTTNSLKGDDK